MAKKILIIDDDRSFAEMVAQFLKSQGCSVLFASSLQEALEMFKREKPALVLLDYDMPILTGDKVAPRLQALTPGLRIIVVTGCTESEVEEKFKGLGYYAIFHKGSMSLADLKDKVNQALNFT